MAVSSRKPSALFASRLGDDVLAVLAALNVNRPVLVGNSIAGQELSSVGYRHPDKVAGLVYLDAAYSYAYYDSFLGDFNIELIEVRRKLEELQSKFLDTRSLIQELLETDLPRLQRVLREKQKDLQATPGALLAAYAQAEGNLSPAVRAIQLGRQKYIHIPVPILAIYAVPPNFENLPRVIPWNERLSKLGLRLQSRHRRALSKPGCLRRGWCACRTLGTNCFPRTKRT